MTNENEQMPSLINDTQGDWRDWLDNNPNTSGDDTRTMDGSQSD